MRHWVVVFAVSVISVGAFAQPAVPPCGTTDARVRQAEDLAVWSAARQREMISKGAQPLGNPVVRDSVVVLTADQTSAPHRRPFDLEGRSLLFARKSAETFSRRNADLDYDDMTGATAKFAGSGGLVSYTLPFAFPFFDTMVTGVSLSQGNAIVIGSAPLVPAKQFNDAELAGMKAAVIAPLWMTSAVITGSNVPAIMVKELGDRVSISWSVDRSSLSYDVQATLFTNGDIRFSYKRARAVPIGAIVITSGNEPWRSDQTMIATATDPLGDVTGSASTTLRPLLDINSFTIVRIAGSNLIEFRMKVSGERSQLASSESAIYSVFIGDPLLRQYVSFTMSGSGNDGYVLPVWGSISKSPAARMEGDTVIMDVLQDDLVGSLANVSIRGYSQSGTSQFADSISITATVDQPSRAVRTDFHSMSADESSGPIEEAFTLAVLSPGGVWSEVRSAWGLADGQYDGIAIYQNFLTDIVLYAGAYSTGGNAAVSGIKLGASPAPSPQRTPNLLHMNAVGYGWNATTDNAGHLILHEFGHRWLYLLGIMQNGSMTRVLNPASSHPAQYVHTPAAFRVLTPADASVMGGSAWTDDANGTFTSPAFSNFAYSWLDLYLMGLADKSEVQPFYYISDSSPKLGDAYYPPPSQAFSGNRNDVIMQQVIDAMGERKPAYPETQRHFNVLFVLVATPDRAVSQDEVDRVANYRKLLEERFSLATAGRAAVTTSFTLPLPGGPRRRVTK